MNSSKANSSEPPRLSSKRKFASHEFQRNPTIPFKKPKVQANSYTADATVFINENNSIDSLNDSQFSKESERALLESFGASLTFKSSSTVHKCSKHKESERPPLTPSNAVTKCTGGHMLKAEADAQSECAICQQRLKNCANYAKLHNGRLVDTEYGGYICFECAGGHVWRVKYGS